MKKFISKVKKATKDFFTNKSAFSLVELIVVIAIMAVMAAVLAPALLGYVERSRAQKDDSAFSEVVNSVQLSLADQNVYDELLPYTVKGNFSCYCDGDTSTNTDANKIITKSPDYWLFNDETRKLDETAYFPAGSMRGATVTFKPNGEAEYILKAGIVNQIGDESTKKGTNGGAVLEDCPELYNRLRSTVGDTIKVSSQTYRNSTYTIFISMGTTGGNQADKQDAIQVYGQYNGTNLPEVMTATGSGSQNQDSNNDSLTADQLDAEYEVAYYDELLTAVNDINNDTVGFNANSDKQNAAVACYVDENEKANIVLLRDLSTATAQITQDIILNLNGKKITTTSNIAINIKSGTVDINGKVAGSSILVNEYVNAKTSIAVAQCLAGATLNVDGGTYESIASDDDTVYVFYLSGTSKITNAKIVARHTSPPSVSQTKSLYAVSSRARANNTLINSTILAESDIVANKSNQLYTGAYAVYNATNSNLTIQGCTVNGSFAGVYSKGNLLIDGGTYKGYCNGGVDIGGGANVQINNATITDATLGNFKSYFEQDDGSFKEMENGNETGFYTHKADGGTVQLNNCQLSGAKRPLCIQNQTKGLSLCLSNCTINKNSRNGIVIGASSKSILYIGKGNNFTAAETNAPDMCVETEQEYK